jgi:hypothetical protein
VDRLSKVVIPRTAKNRPGRRFRTGQAIFQNVGGEVEDVPGVELVLVD